MESPLQLQRVEPDGVLPTGTTEAVDIFDFSELPGFGGRPGTGNTVVAGIPMEGVGSFSGLRGLQLGDQIQLSLGGRVFDYTAVIVCRAPVEAFEALLKTTTAEILTLIQASSDNERLYAIAERVPNSIPRVCPEGEQG